MQVIINVLEIIDNYFIDIILEVGLSIYLSFYAFLHRKKLPYYIKEYGNLRLRNVKAMMHLSYPASLFESHRLISRFVLSVFLAMLMAIIFHGYLFDAAFESRKKSLNTDYLDFQYYEEIWLLLFFPVFYFVSRRTLFIISHRKKVMGKEFKFSQKFIYIAVCLLHENKLDPNTNKLKINLINKKQDYLKIKKDHIKKIDIDRNWIKVSHICDDITGEDIYLYSATSPKKLAKILKEQLPDTNIIIA